MSKQIAYVPLNKINRIQIYINKYKKSLAQIKKETGADYLINGGLYDMSKFIPYCHLKVDGYVHAKDQYTYWGFGWNTGSDISMVSDYFNLKNYICCTTLIDPNGVVKKLTYTPAQGGNRGRTAIGLKGGNLCLYVSNDGSRDTNTPEGLQDELNDIGWDRAIMLDSGGSSQCDMNGRIISSIREVQNLILVYVNKDKKEDTKPIVSDKKYIVCLDAGHGLNTVNGSPDGTYKEVEFTWDMYTRLKPLLEKQGINVVSTRTREVKPSLTERANVSNRAKANLLVSIHTNATGGSGWSSASGLIVYTSASGDTAKRNIAAKTTLKRFGEDGISIRGSGLAHNIDLTVLRKAYAPAMLIEYGFHTNNDDVALLKQSNYRDKLAVATAKGVCDYLGVEYKDDILVDIPVVTDQNEDVADWAKTAWDKAKAKGINDGAGAKNQITEEQLMVFFDKLGLLD